MSNWTAPHPVLGAGPVLWAPGRLRVLVAAALALGLHATLLFSIRPTLIGSAARDAPPTMFVRILTQDAATMATASQAPAAPALPTATAAPLAVEPSPTTGTPTGDRPTDAVPAAAGTASTVITAKTPPIPASQPSQAVQPGLPPAPTYLAAGRLDPGPRPLEDVEPVYPEEAQLQEGSVVLRLLINEAGTVDNVAVVRAYPTGLFERSALEAFGSAKFSPGKMLGVAVKSQITIEVMFTPINRGARVSGRSY